MLFETICYGLFPFIHLSLVQIDVPLIEQYLIGHKASFASLSSRVSLDPLNEFFQLFSLIDEQSTLTVSYHLHSTRQQSFWKHLFGATGVHQIFATTI